MVRYSKVQGHLYFIYVFFVIYIYGFSICFQQKRNYVVTKKSEKINQNLF